MKTACIEAVRLAREQDGGDQDDLADRIHSRLQLPVLAPIPKVRLLQLTPVLCWGRKLVPEVYRQDVSLIRKVWAGVVGWLWGASDVLGWTAQAWSGRYCCCCMLPCTGAGSILMVSPSLVGTRKCRLSHIWSTCCTNLLHCNSQACLNSQPKSQCWIAR